MRYVALLCVSVLLSGCLDEDLYADGEPWVPVEERDVTKLLKNDALVKNPYLRRMPTTEQEWTRFIQTLNAQPVRNLGDVVQTFTPAWTGFSADPSGDLSYMDLGDLVVLWNNTAGQVVGTSNANTMTFTNLPSVIRPDQSVIDSTIVIDSGSAFHGQVSILANGTVGFTLMTVSGSLIQAGVGGLFTAAGNKGLPTGWLIMYPK